MSGTKNLVIMAGAMLALKGIDQEDPDVLMYTRLGFAAYVLCTLAINLFLHFKVVVAKDMTVVTVPPPSASPFSLPPPPSTDPVSSSDPPADRQTTALEYDLSLLQTARRSWLINVVILTLIHMKTASVSPLLMSCIMGLSRVVDEPLFKLHVLGMPSLGPLKRPFPPEPNPLASMLQGLLPKPPTQVEDGPQASTNPTQRVSSRDSTYDRAYVEEVHDDGDDDEDDDDVPDPAAISNHDDPTDNDFAHEVSDGSKKDN